MTSRLSRCTSRHRQHNLGRAGICRPGRAIRPAGLADALRTAKADEAIWCGSDAIAEADYKALDRPNVSRFIYALGDRDLIPDHRIGVKADF